MNDIQLVWYLKKTTCFILYRFVKLLQIISEGCWAFNVTYYYLLFTIIIIIIIVIIKHISLRDLIYGAIISYDEHALCFGRTFTPALPIIT